MTGRRFALIAFIIGFSFNSHATKVQLTDQAYLVDQQIEHTAALSQPPTLKFNTNKAQAVPSSPSSRFNEIDDFKFGKGNSRGQRHRDHWHSGDNCYNAGQKIRHAAYQLTNLSLSGQIQFSSWQAQNYYQMSMQQLHEAARMLNNSYYGRSRAVSILNSYIPYLRSLAMQGHIRFWDQYGRRQFRENMRRLRNARDMLGEVHMFRAYPRQRFAL